MQDLSILLASFIWKCGDLSLRQTFLFVFSDNIWLQETLLLLREGNEIVKVVPLEENLISFVDDT